MSLKKLKLKISLFSKKFLQLKESETYSIKKERVKKTSRK